MPHPDAPVPLDELLAHREWVRRMAGALAASDADADDLAQDAWVAALEHPPRHATSLRGWFAGLLRHRLLNRRRGEVRRAAREESAVPSASAPDPAEVVAHAELHRSVVDAVLSLDEPYRTTILLRFFEDLPPREVARRLGVPVETVRSRVQRAVAQLRERLDRQQEGDRDTRRAAWAVPLLAWGRAPDGVGRPSAGTGASTGASAAAAVAGGGLMAGLATKSGLAAAAVVLLLLVGGGAVWLNRAPVPAPAAPPGDTAAVVDSRHPPRAARPVADDSATQTAPASGVDPFAAADRDLDLCVRVVDRAGAPVAGAKLRALRRPWRSAGLRAGSDHVWDEDEGPAGTTGADGCAVLRLDAGDVVDLEVVADAFAARTVADLAAGERTTIVLDLGVRLTVTVRDERTAPVAGARVEAMRSAWPGGTDVLRVTGTTGADGRCTLPAVAGNQEVLVSASSDGLAPSSDFVKAKLPESGGASAEVVLAVGREVTGHVLDAATGAPLTDATIWTSMMTTTVPVAPDGGFRVRVSAAEPKFAARAPGHLWELVDAKDRADVEVRLRAAGTVRGRVIDTAGQPVAGACLLSASEGPEPVTRADAEGRFVLDGVLPATDIAIGFYARGHGRLVVDAHVPADGALDLGEVVLAAARSISGRVLDGDGRPLPRVLVMVTGVNGDRESRGGVGWPPPHFAFQQTRSTDDLGRFRFADLSAGSWIVEAHPTKGERIAENVGLTALADVADLVLTAGPSGRFTARVRDEAGNPVRDAVVLVWSMNGSQRRAVTGVDGVAVADLPGEVRSAAIESAAADGRALRTVQGPKPAEVKGTHEATFVVREMAWVAGRVEDADGKPVAGEVLCLAADGSSVTSAYSDATGAFRAVVPRGATCDVEFEWARDGTPGSGCAGGVIGVVAGTTDVVVRVRPPEDTGSLTVVALTTAGEPVPGVGLTLYDQRTNTSPGYRTTDVEGRAHWTGIASRGFSLEILERLDGRDAPWRAAGLLEPPGWLHIRPHGQELVLRFRRARAAEGRIAMPKGWPTLGLEVHADVGERRVSHATVAPDGTFSIPLPLDEPGPFRVAFAARRMADNKNAEGEVTDVRPGDSGLVLVVTER